MTDQFSKSALKYHSAHPAGKLAIVATKPMETQRDLSLAYSPGVAIACEAIAAKPEQVYNLTAKGNLVGVISNGSAVLGLGNIGALASKPVMEGKAVLFKKFSGIDVFDLEIDQNNIDKFIDTVASLEPTFGGINLEDIKAPECFEIERILSERMNIPVFHDDQHGTAIVVTAAINSALKLVNKDIKKVRLVVSGAGAAALSCIKLLIDLGLDQCKLLVLDRKGVIHSERTSGIDKYKAPFAAKTKARTMDDAIQGADIFLGCSGPGSLTGDQVKKMVKDPIILALANPDPEIMPEEVYAANPNAIMATGRSDYPNQVNNVLCFPFIFRGALDVGATTINKEMKLACVNALTQLAMQPPPEEVKAAYTSESLEFGPNYLIPKPFDHRLIVEVASAVAKAAMDSGVATRQIADLQQYRQHLSEFVHKSSAIMYPIMERAKKKKVRLCYTEAEDERVLQAVQQVVESKIAFPVLVGNTEKIIHTINKLHLTIKPGTDCEIINFRDKSIVDTYAPEYLKLMGRKGVSPARAKHVVCSRSSVLSCLMLHTGAVDAVLFGAVSPFYRRLGIVNELIGRHKGVTSLSALVGVILPLGTYFICDTHVTYDPTVEELVEMSILAAQEVRRFGIVPKIAMVSHSSFGSSREAAAKKMSKATELLRKQMTDIEIDGEMSAEAALSPVFRDRLCPESLIKGQANLLVMPNRDAAHVAYTLMKSVVGATVIGPILLGTAHPVNIVSESVSVRGMVNMSAITAVQAQLS